MTNISPSLQFFLHLTKMQTVVSRRFDSRLGGLSLNEFIILFHLSQAPGEKLRRIDLAENIGLTASGVTRSLLPMEKVGLVGRETNEQDARVSFVTLAAGGKQKLLEALERAELIASDAIPTAKKEQLAELSALVEGIGGAMLWK